MSAPVSTEQVLNTFSYGVTVKARGMGVDLLGSSLPGVSTITIASRDFTSYDECVTSCRRLMDDVLAKAGEDRFKLGSEINPVFSGQPTLSKDWSLGEVSRIWIYEKSMEKTGQIHAVGQAKIFGVIRQPDASFN